MNSWARETTLRCVLCGEIKKFFGEDISERERWKDKHYKDGFPVCVRISNSHVDILQKGAMSLVKALGAGIGLMTTNASPSTPFVDFTNLNIGTDWQNLQNRYAHEIARSLGLPEEQQLRPYWPVQPNRQRDEIGISGIGWYQYYDHLQRFHALKIDIQLSDRREMGFIASINDITDSLDPLSYFRFEFYNSFERCMGKKFKDMPIASIAQDVMNALERRIEDIPSHSLSYTI